MREIPKIVQELKKIEEQGKLDSVSSVETTSFVQNHEEADSNILNPPVFKGGPGTSKHDCFCFQNFEMFITHCVDFLELYPESLLVLDMKGDIKYVNSKFVAWIGFKKGDLLDKEFYSSPFFSSENERTIISSLFDQSKEKTNDPVEMIFIRGDRQHLTGLLSINSVMNYQNERIGVLIGITDITGLKIEKEEAYKLNQFHKSIMDNETIWLSVSDLSANVILWNKAAEYISGYSQNEVLGHNKVWEWLKFNTCSGGGLVTKKGHTKIGDTVISDDYETLIKRKDGGQRIISWTSRMFYDNNRNPMGTIAIGKDITELKENEKKIKVQNEELSSLNKHLEEMVQVRTNKIQDLLQQKNDFINQLGHDLKTPLTPMMVLLPIIKKELEKPDKKEIIDVLIRNTTYMKDLITKTIELAKLNSDMVEFSITSVNLFNEIDFILSNNNYLFEEKHISVVNHVSKDLFVQADVLRLREILLNIVTNSVKYTPNEGGEILIDAREQDEMVQVSIKDTGIGMKPEQIHKIFDEFYKADESRHNLDSSGLGLNIAKRLVEMHKGHIWAESEGLGKGSTFCFTLMKTK